MVVYLKMASAIERSKQARKGRLYRWLEWPIRGLHLRPYRRSFTSSSYGWSELLSQSRRLLWDK